MKLTIYGKKRGFKMRKILWEKDKYCMWCGVETILMEGFESTKENPAPPNMATIEHYFSRISEIPRLEKNEKFIACYRCNTLRAKWENRIRNRAGRLLFVEEVEKIANKLLKQKSPTEH